MEGGKNAQGEGIKKREGILIFKKKQNSAKRGGRARKRELEMGEGVRPSAMHSRFEAHAVQTENKERQ